MTNTNDLPFGNAPVSWSNDLGEFTLLNGVVGDVAIKTIFNQTGETTLFDLGDLKNMTYSELLSVRQAFISHAHFDHIIGFDSLLRATFPLCRPLTFAGPVGIADIMANRMKGYTWNLAEPDQVDHTIREIGRDGSVRSYHTSNTNNFEPIPIDNEPLWTDAMNGTPFEGLPVASVGRITGGLRIFAVCLDHAGTDSIAYCVLSDAKLKFNAQLLPSLGLKSGAWISAFQKSYLQNDLANTIPFEDRDRTVGELAEQLLTIKPGLKLCYLTDFGATSDNLDRVRPFIAGADYLFIESNYCDGQDDLAKANGHLTTRQAARLIVESGASQWSTFHFSNAFQDTPELPFIETRRFIEEAGA